MRAFLTIAVALSLFAAGCVEPPPDDSGGTSQTSLNGQGDAQVLPAEYRFPLPADPLSLDPAHITDTVSDTVSRRIFNNLVKFAYDGSVAPDLAESWRISEDGLVYEFVLYEGVRFHNGEDLVADDVIYSYQRLLDPETDSERANLLYYVKGAREYNSGESEELGIEAVDERNVRFTLSEPYAPFLMVLCMSNFGVVSHSGVEPDPKGFGSNPVGSGPFVFKSWERGERVTLKANRDYFAGEPKLDTVMFLVIEDEKTRFENFKAGALEHCDIPPSQISEVRNSEKLSSLIHGEPAMDMYCYGFNCEQPPFKDNTALRRALNYAVDKRNIIENIWGGLVTEQVAYVPPGMFYYWEDSQGYGYDPELARKLLEEAGYPDGEGLPELVLNIDTQLTNKFVAEAVQEDLRKVGVTVSIEVTDWGSFLPKVYAGESLFFQNTWLGDYPDPDTWLYQLLHSDNFGDAGNITRWANSEFDHFVKMAQVEMDSTQRAELYRKAEQIAFKEAPWLLLFWKNSATLVQPYVQDFEISGMDRTPQCNNVPLEEVYFSAK
jgi:peptide/nickel transport system substrate-binding protein/oligopeptide transport system substrate-binding protein